MLAQDSNVEHTNDLSFAKICEITAIVITHWKCPQYGSHHLKKTLNLLRHVYMQQLCVMQVKN